MVRPLLWWVLIGLFLAGGWLSQTGMEAVEAYNTENLVDIQAVTVTEQSVQMGNWNEAEWRTFIFYLQSELPAAEKQNITQVPSAQGYG